MASAGRSLVDQGCGTTDESVVASGSDDYEGLAALDTGRRVALVTLMFVDCKGFTSDGGLIDLEEGIIGNDATIGWNNGALLICQRVA